jgi:hypothetical protein
MYKKKEENIHTHLHKVKSIKKLVKPISQLFQKLNKTVRRSL